MRVRVVQHRDRRRAALRRRVVWGGGELLVTAGVLVLLLVVHQLWWTNREARAGAERKVRALEREWGNGASGAGSGSGAGRGSATAGAASEGGSGGAEGGRQGAGAGGRRASGASPRVSQAYAVVVIPRLGLRAPVAEGTGKRDVLNKGYVGHYRGTQQPGQAGNFALAGHRNTHGEPFRYLNRLRVRDVVRIETASAVYTYTVGEILPRTSARDFGVLRPVPRSVVRPSYGYTRPGHYLTLTTCTPEYTSRYRLVVWGTLTSTHPR
ncbi:class E sortase [Streptomyces sp. NPDC047000]|uniref:class E sortase n=1 Tax=Streptomyces sp. NPDC047000 TaxID=3155474 RepID=UPI0033FF348E